MGDGFGTLVRKELLEIARTWRRFVLPGMMLAFALLGPLMAKATPDILRAVGGAQLAALVAAMPTPAYMDAYGQWIKNLSQIVLIAVVIIYGGLVSSERASGTAVLVLTKPVSRRAFVAAKAMVHMLFIGVLTVAGTLLTWAVTALVFPAAPGATLWQASLSWLVLAWFFLALMTYLSTVIRSPAGAAGAGIAAFAVLALAAMAPAAVLFTPAGLIVAPAAVAAGKSFPSVWPVVGSLIASAALVWAAAETFERQEL